MNIQELNPHIEMLTTASEEGQAMMQELLDLMQRGLSFGLAIDQLEAVYVLPCRTLNLMDAIESSTPMAVDHENLGTIQILAQSGSHPGYLTITFNEAATDIGKSIFGDLREIINRGLRFALNVDKVTEIPQSIAVTRMSSNGPVGGATLLPGRDDMEMLGSLPPIFVGSASIACVETDLAPVPLESLEMPGKVDRAQAYLGQLNELIVDIAQRLSTEPHNTHDEDRWVRNAHRAILNELSVRIQDLSSAVDVHRPNLAAGAARAIYETFLISLSIVHHPELAKRWIVHSAWKSAVHHNKMGAVLDQEDLERWDQFKQQFGDAVDFDDDRGWAKCILSQLGDNNRPRRISLEKALGVEELRIVKEYSYYLHPIARLQRMEYGNFIPREDELLAPLCHAVEFIGAVAGLTTSVSQVIDTLPADAHESVQRLAGVIIDGVSRILREFGVEPDDKLP